jgi:hypothetical protein
MAQRLFERALALSNSNVWTCPGFVER